MLLLTLLFVVYPFGETSWLLLTDRGLRGAGPSTYAYNLHAALSAELPGYVDRRIKSGVAETLGVHQITATESPIYGAFFYLLATENLQALWEKDHSLAARAPKETGAAAMDACARILTDPGHAHFVRTYWGDDHLTDPNCFFRCLLVGGLGAHHRLTGKTDHLPLLQKIIADLAADIDSSRHGLIDDYPDQCFPCDVVAAIEMIRRADPSREDWARKAFHRVMANFKGDLPPYMAVEETGKEWGPSRGCTNGFFFSYARHLDPDMADRLYQKYIDGYWQRGNFAAGWREFPKGSNHSDTYFDPDSGPVLWGFGTGATGLGIGLTRLHGDHERAGMLGAEMIAGSFPMVDGSLLLPRFVSDWQHAPHFAETVILHQLSLTGGTPSLTKAPLTGAVWLILGVEFLLGFLLLRWAKHLIWPKRKKPAAAAP